MYAKEQVIYLLFDGVNDGIDEGDKLLYTKDVNFATYRDVCNTYQK